MQCRALEIAGMCKQCMNKGGYADLLGHALLHVGSHDGVTCHYGRLHIAAAA